MGKGKALNYDRAAMALCDAVMMGDRKAAEKWNVTQRTIQQWRSRLEKDEKLRSLTQQLRNKQTEKWLEDIPVALSTFVTYCTNATQEMDFRAENMLAVVAAFEAIADVKLTEKIISERLSYAEE